MKFWTGIVVCIIGLALVLTGVVFQCILSVKMYGVIFTDHIIIWHWSLAFYAGVVPIFIGSAMLST